MGQRGPLGSCGFNKTTSIIEFPLLKKGAQWQECKAFQSADYKVRAEQRLMGSNPEMKPAQYNQMKDVFERTHGEKDPDRLPGSTILEELNAQKADGRWRA